VDAEFAEKFKYVRLGRRALEQSSREALSPFEKTIRDQAQDRSFGELAFAFTLIL
jgi:hypothetical protein